MIFFRKSAILLLFSVGVIQVSRAQPADFWNVSFTKADSIAFLYHGANLRNPDALADSLTSHLSMDAEKFRAIFRWITDNISYDYDLYLQKVAKESKLKTSRQKAKRHLTRISKKTFRRTILKKKAICSGYAMLLEYMANRAGLNCEIVVGYAMDYDIKLTRQPNHAWNAVQLDSKWYLCDVTWASGSVDPDVGRFFKQFKAKYFLTDPHLFQASHYPVEERWLLLQNPPSLNAFINAPFRPEGFIDNKINRYYPERGSIRTKAGHAVTFMFTSNSDFIEPTAKLSIRRLKQVKTVEANVAQNENGEYELIHTFYEKGEHLLYIDINNECTFVYRVFVQ